MITKEPTNVMIDKWKTIWLQYKDKLQPNRKSGAELLDYLENNYVLTEIYDKNMTDVIIDNVTMNIQRAEKLPSGSIPTPRAFLIENIGKGKMLYNLENKDPAELWGKDVIKIFVGVDIASGYYMVEGSTMLWDELCAFQGLDEMDIENFVCVAEYINSLKRFKKEII